MQEQKQKAAIYIRVSTDAQAEEGYSIDAQKEQLTAYCISKAIKNYDYYIDGGWSGSNLNRPEIQRLMKDAKDNKISHCIVYKLDRLSRSQKDVLYIIEDIFMPYGIDFVSLTESLDTSTAMGRAMIGILAAFAQLERENIRMRTRMGMKERIKEGYWMGGGRVPFGYDYDKGQGILVPNKDADTVKKVYELYIRGYSAQNIANMLGLRYDGLATQILKRKCNYGVIEYRGEEYKGKHEPIISKEIYDLAMDEMLKRSSTNVTTSDHLLTGLVYCGKCGAKMRYQNWGKNGYKFVCYSQQSSKPYLIKDPNCNQKKQWADEVESEVIKKIFALKEKIFSSGINAESIEANPIDILNKQKSEIEKRIKTLYNLYANTEDELLLETINENKKKLDIVNKRITKEKESQVIKVNRNRLYTSLDSLESKWEYMTIKERQTIVRSLIHRITIFDDKITIELLF